jgi:hypothetical protein
MERMRKIPIEIAIDVERDVPGLVDVLHKGGSDPIVLSLRGFEGRERLLYDCIWYVASSGRRVEIEALD